MFHCYKCNMPNFAGEFVSYTGPQCQCWARYAPAHNVTRTRSEDAQTAIARWMTAKAELEAAGEES